MNKQKYKLNYNHSDQRVRLIDKARKTYSGDITFERTIGGSDYLWVDSKHLGEKVVFTENPDFQLRIGGKDSATNEEILKKIHKDLYGSERDLVVKLVKVGA